MNLATYLKQSDIKPSAFAATMGVAPSTVGRWIKAERHPKPDQVRRIYILTKGKVTANDFMKETV